MKLYEVFGLALNGAELTACGVAFAMRRKWRGTPWHSFAWYLLFIVALETVGYFTRTRELGWLNKLLYNRLVIPVEFLTAFAIFYLTSATSRGRRVAVSFAGVYAAVLVTEILIETDDYRVYYSISYTMGNVLLLALIIRFLIRMATSDAILTFHRNMMFWVCTGWLLFYILTFPYFGLMYFLHNQYPQIFVPYTYAMFALNATMYLTIAAGYLWARPD